MGMIDVPQIEIGSFIRPGYKIGDSSTYFENSAIDAAGEKFAMVFRAPKTGNIDRVGFRVGAVTDSQTLKASLQSVDMSDGNPTGTILASANGYGTQSSPAADTFYEVTLNTAVAVTQNDYLALVIEYDEPDGDLEICTAQNGSIVVQFPYARHYTEGWGEVDHRPIASIRYDDGTYPYTGMIAVKDTSEGSFGSGQERGMRFKLPFSCRLKGVIAFTYLSGDCDLVLYDSAQSELETASFDVNAKNRSSSGLNVYLLDTPQAIEKNEIYYLTIKYTGGSDLYVQWFDVLSQNMLETLGADKKMYWCEGAAPCMTTTNTRRPPWNLLIDQVEVDGRGDVIFNKKFN